MQFRNNVPYYSFDVCQHGRGFRRPAVNYLGEIVIRHSLIPLVVVERAFCARWPRRDSLPPNTALTRGPQLEGAEGPSEPGTSASNGLVGAASGGADRDMEPRGRRRRRRQRAAQGRAVFAHPLQQQGYTYFVSQLNKTFRIIYHRLEMFHGCIYKLPMSVADLHFNKILARYFLYRFQFRGILMKGQFCQLETNICYH